MTRRSHCDIVWHPAWRAKANRNPIALVALRYERQNSHAALELQKAAVLLVNSNQHCSQRPVPSSASSIARKKFSVSVGSLYLPAELR